MALGNGFLAVFRDTEAAVAHYVGHFRSFSPDISRFTRSECGIPMSNDLSNIAVALPFNYLRANSNFPIVLTFYRVFRLANVNFVLSFVFA